MCTLPPADAAGGVARGGGASRWAEVQLALNGQNFVGGRDAPPPSSRRGVAFLRADQRDARGASFVVDDHMSDVPRDSLWYLDEAGRAPHPKRCDGAALRRLLLPDRLVPAASPWRPHLKVALAAAPPPAPAAAERPLSGSARLALLEGARRRRGCRGPRACP